MQAMGVQSEEEAAAFVEAVTEVMHRVEGISHFTIENFYTFDYLQSVAEH